MHMLKRIALFFTFVWIPLAEEDTEEVQEAVAQSPIAAQHLYYVGPRDTLEVTVQGLKEFEKKGYGDEMEFIVTDDGFINVPLVGLVKAAGKTCPQVGSELRQKYTKFVTTPQASVVVKKYNSKLVHVLGKVFQNGSVPLKHEKTTLFEVIAEAGGFSSKNPSIEGTILNEPDMRHIYVLRAGKKIVVNLYDKLIDKNDEQPFFMMAGDRVFVPEPVETISILGGVKKAGSMELKAGLTLLQAIALAGSFTENARRDNVKIIRKNKTDSVHVNAKSIFDGKETDFVLSAGDVIYIAEW